MTDTMIDPTIEQLLMEVGGGNAQSVMDNAGGDWYPPPGVDRDNPATYDLLMKPIGKRVHKFKAKDGVEYPVLNISGTILTPGEYEGKVGSIPLFFNNQGHAGVAKSLARMLGYAGSDVVGIIRTLITSLGGSQVRLAHWFSPNRKNAEQPFTNYSVESVTPADVQ